MKTFGLQTFIWRNNLRSLLLLCLFPCIIAFLVFIMAFAAVASEGSSVESSTNLAMQLLMDSSFYILGGVALWFVIAWMFHTRMILSMTGAKELTRVEHKDIYLMVEHLCISRGLPVPKLYIIEDSSMNAFASGLQPSKSLIAFSRGLIDTLTPKELEAVAAHELTHIINRDSRLMVICIIFVGIIQTLSEVFLRMRIEHKSGGENSGNSMLIILALKVVIFIIGFMFTSVIQMAISRKREFLADAGAVELTKTGKHLITALQKISTDSRIEVIKNRNVAQLCIENPLDKPHFFDTLFASHPPISKRIAALQEFS